MSSLSAFLPLRKIQLQTALLEMFMNGLYTCLFIATMYSMTFRKKLHRFNIPLFLAVIAMYTFSTVYAALHWVLVKNAFIDNGDTAESTLTYLLAPPLWLVVVPGVLFPANMLVADCVLIWRCWIVWDRRFKVVLIPILCTIAGTVFGFLSVVGEAESILHPDLQVEWSGFELLWFILSLVTTLSATLLIIIRILMMTDRRASGYGRVIEIIIESAALYCVIITLPFTLRNNANVGYPEVILGQVTGIGPTLIVARVSFGLAQPDDAWKGRSNPNSTIRFRMQSHPSTHVNLPNTQGINSLHDSHELKEEAV
ncbi:hypothetical protein FB451DRAFT_1556914 [Mycena latifolia]|nr:hypothetical protein FB451DRAFT_1556914 [Mycena latifolia]